MPDYLISSGLPQLPSGLSDKDASLVTPLYRAVNSLAQQISYHTGNVQFDGSEQAQANQLTKLLDSRTQKIFVKAGEALAYGQLLNLTVAAGKIIASKADAALGKPAHAVCDTVGGIALNAFGEAIFMQGRTAGISGTGFGTTYYLSTAGAVQATAPVTTGTICQIVGIGLGSEGLYLNILPAGKTVTLAYKFNATTLRVQYADGTYADLAV